MISGNYDLDINMTKGQFFSLNFYGGAFFLRYFFFTRNSPVIIMQIMGSLISCDACGGNAEPPGIRQPGKVRNNFPLKLTTCCTIYLYI